MKRQVLKCAALEHKRAGLVNQRPLPRLVAPDPDVFHFDRSHTRLRTRNHEWLLRGGNHHHIPHPVAANWRKIQLEALSVLDKHPLVTGLTNAGVTNARAVAARRKFSP